MFLKRIADVLLSVALLVVLAPLMALVAVLVRLSSRGPIIYGGFRVGHRGQDFYIYKFRSLTANSAKPGVDVVIPGDKRITPLGTWLRKWYLDELPQLVNVLRGEMSLIGPRPHTRGDADHRAKQIFGYQRRERVRPGMSGLAQVLLRRSQTKKNQKRGLACDLYYIQHYSFWLDFKILLRTCVIVCQGKGA